MAKRPPRPRKLKRIESEADLRPFQLSDPFALPSDLHGNARWAWLQHMWRAGMVQSADDWAREAAGYPLCQGRLWADDDGTEVEYKYAACWPHEGHRLIVGAPGAGKFTCAIATLLLTDDGHNAVVIDPKGGEAFRHTAAFRNLLATDEDTPGVRILDASGLYADYITSDSLNPLDLIRADNPNLVSDTDKLVDALIVVSGHEREPVWAMSAKKVLRAMIIHVATYPARAATTPTLMDVQRVISEDIDDAVLREMAQNPVADGLVQRQALEISALKSAEATWRGVKFQIDASFAFLDNTGVRKTLGATSFDVRALRRDRLSLYIVVPNKDKDALGRWLRLIYTTVIDQIDTLPGRPVHVVLDEFAALGQFGRVLTDLATMRSAGLKFHLAIQDLNQLSEHYGHGWQTIVGNCAVRQILGVNDNFTAEYISRALGQTTIQDGYDLQQEFPDHPAKKRPRFVGRDLMTPAEVLSMDRELMIVFADRCSRPIRIHKNHYFETRTDVAIDLFTLERSPSA